MYIFLSFPFIKSRNVLNEPMFTTNSCTILQKSSILKHELFLLVYEIRRSTGITLETMC